MENSVDYKIINSPAKGQIRISEHSRYNLLEADTVIVEPGVRAQLYGDIKDLLVLKKNSKVFLHGKIKGKVQDEGGRLYLFEE